MLELCDSSCAKLTTLGKVSSTRVLRHSGKDAQVEDLPPGTSLPSHPPLSARGGFRHKVHVLSETLPV